MSNQLPTTSIENLVNAIKSEEDHLRSILPSASDALKTKGDEILKILSNADLDPQKTRAANPDDKALSQWTNWATSQVETLRTLSETVRRESKNAPTKPVTRPGSMVDEMESDVWKIRQEVQAGIDSVRDDVYKLQEVRFSPWSDVLPEKEGLKSLSIPANVQELEKLATDEVQIARDEYADTLQKIDPTPNDLLQMISNAGSMLEATERLMLGYDRLRTQSPPPKPDAVLPAATTIVKTAREEIHSAKSLTENLRSYLGNWEMGQVRNKYLIPAVFLYIVFHPSLPVTQSIFPGSQAAAFLVAIRPYWEIVFWSFFGAISMSIVTIAHDYKQDTFDSRHIGKYKFRIQIAPFVTVAIIFFLSVVLFEIASSGTGGGGKVTVDLSSPSIPLLIMLSFILGFFGKKSLDLLSSIWTKLFESIDSKTSRTSGKKSSDSGS